MHPSQLRRCIPQPWPPTTVSLCTNYRRLLATKGRNNDQLQGVPTSMLLAANGLSSATVGAALTTTTAHHFTIVIGGNQPWFLLEWLLTTLNHQRRQLTALTMAASHDNHEPLACPSTNHQSTIMNHKPSLLTTVNLHLPCLVL